MLGLPSWQALKALRNPFRSTLPNPLHVPLQTRHLHNSPEPFAGLPSYATLARRFSASSPNPVSYFAEKAAKEAIDRGRFVDIHDVVGVQPKDYDVLLSDVNKDTLHTDISKVIGIPYLKEATKGEADKVAREINGVLYGETFRMILPCVLSAKDTARWVFFIVDSSCPSNYISAEVAQAFGLDLKEYSWVAKIAGHLSAVHLSPLDSHFADLNLLSKDFITKNRMRLWLDDELGLITYFIGKGRWKRPEPMPEPMPEPEPKMRLLSVSTEALPTASGNM